MIWQYTGLSTTEMEQRVTTYSQYSISSNVNNIRDIEAQTLNGISVQKIYFQPDVNLDLAIAQIVSATNSIRAPMPVGIEPPIVVQFNASSVPVLQISLSSDSLTEAELYDYGIYNLRQRLAPIHGVTLPTPTGEVPTDHGRHRSGKAPAATDAARRGNAVNAQNLTLPSGTAKIGDTQFVVQTNAMPKTIDELTAIRSNTAMAPRYSCAISVVRDGYAVHRISCVKVEFARYCSASSRMERASTLDVVNGVKTALGVARAAALPGLQISELF